MRRKFEEDRETRVGIWNSGEDLNHAWTVYGEKRLKEERKAAHGTPRSRALIREMNWGIIERLSEGELLAYGFRIRPDASDGPVAIPADAFEQPLPASWEDNGIEASGYVYERVKVLSASDRGQAKVISSVSRSPVGRRDTYPLCKPVIVALFRDHPELESLSAQKLHSRFCALYREHHGAAADLTPPPSERTLREHLKRYRSEEIGRNGQQ